MAEEKQEILEEALEIAEEQVEVVVKSAGLLKRIIWNHKTHVSVAFVAGAGVGAGVAYKITKDKLTYRFDELLTTEVEAVRDSYDRKHMTGAYADPVEVAKRLIPEDERAKEAHEALHEYQGGEGVVGESVEEVEALVREEVRQAKRNNVFDNSATEFDWELETERREQLGDAEPYIITFEEFLEDEEFETQKLTYFKADDVLADEQDQALSDDQEIGLVGDNLKFGYGSKDANVVYIRNPRVRLNLEVVQSEGSYAEEVFGVEQDAEDELRHSQRRPSNRRFRSSDE